MNKQDTSPLSMTKWTFRANARRKSEFGVHAQSKHDVQGASTMRHYAIHNPPAAKEMVRENIECLKLMRTKKFATHLKKMAKEAAKFYKAVA